MISQTGRMPPALWQTVLFVGSMLIVLFASKTAINAPAVLLAAGHLGHRAMPSEPPKLTIDPYIRPELATTLQRLQPTMRAAAARHNRQSLSGMSNEEFAATMAVVIYNEHNGWFEEIITPIRTITPLYNQLQQRVNASVLGGDFSIWPVNLRPSVALEILQATLPVPEPTRAISVPVHVTGSRIVLDRYHSQHELFAAINAEISNEPMAIEYLAANLERGLYRAHYEGIAVNWRTLAAWHNQGIVTPEQIATNPTARDYVRRASAYLPVARRLFVTTTPAQVTPLGNPIQRPPRTIS